jgi:hypothetical protein
VLEQAGFEVERVLRFPMFRAGPWQRLLGRLGRKQRKPAECDLWFRARFAG